MPHSVTRLWGKLRCWAVLNPMFSLRIVWIFLSSLRFHEFWNQVSAKKSAGTQRGIESDHLDNVKPSDLGAQEYSPLC